MKLTGVNLNKLGNGPHEAHIEGLLINFSLLDGPQVDMILGNLNGLIFLHEVPDNILDLALTLLRNLQYYESIYIGEIGQEELLDVLELRTFVNRVDHNLFLVVEDFDLHSRILGQQMRYFFSVGVDDHIGNHLFLEGLGRALDEFEDCGAEGVMVDSFCFVVLDKQKDCWYPLQRSQQLHTIT